MALGASSKLQGTHEERFAGLPVCPSLAWSSSRSGLRKGSRPGRRLSEKGPGPREACDRRRSGLQARRFARFSDPLKETRHMYAFYRRQNESSKSSSDLPRVIVPVSDKVRTKRQLSLPPNPILVTAFNNLLGLTFNRGMCH